MILKIRDVFGCEYYWKFIDNFSEISSRPISKEHRQDKRCNPNLYIQSTVTRSVFKVVSLKLFFGRPHPPDSLERRYHNRNHQRLHQ